MQTPLYDMNRFLSFCLHFLCLHYSQCNMQTMGVNMRVILNLFTHSVNEFVTDIKDLPLTFSMVPLQCAQEKLSGLLPRLYLKLCFQCTRMSLTLVVQTKAFLSQDSSECVWFFSFLFCICVAQGAVGCSNQAELSMNHGSKALVQEEMTQFFWLKDGRRHFLQLLLLMCSCAVASLTYACSLLAHKLDKRQVQFPGQLPDISSLRASTSSGLFESSLRQLLDMCMQSVQYWGDDSDWVCCEEAVIIADAIAAKC